MSILPTALPGSPLSPAMAPRISPGFNCALLFSILIPLRNTFLAEKNSKVTFYSVLISALTNIVIIQLLINKYELLGVTISLLISFALNMIIRMYLLYKKYKISLKKKYILFSILIIAIYMLIYYTNIKLINLISFLIAGVIASFIFRRDIKEILLKITKIVKGKFIMFGLVEILKVKI